MLNDMRLRASPWLALILGIMWIVFQVGANHGKFVFGDVYPGICLLVASALLFGVLRWLDRPVQIVKKPDPFAVMPPVRDQRFQADSKSPPTQVDTDSPS